MATFLELFSDTNIKIITSGQVIYNGSIVGFEIKSTMETLGVEGYQGEFLIPRTETDLFPDKADLIKYRFGNGLYFFQEVFIYDKKVGYYTTSSFKFMTRVRKHYPIEN